MTLLEVFCHIDDFCQTFQMPTPKLSLPGVKTSRQHILSMTPSEIMTVLVQFHSSHYRDFKAYYCQHVCVYLASEFPGLPSYQRFVEWMPRTLIPLTLYLVSLFGACSGVSFCDSTKISVCHNRRISRHKTFKTIAQRGKTSVGWFFGFKLHLLFNDQGEVVWLLLTPGNVDDRVGLTNMLEQDECNIFGKIFADKGYISQPLFEKLLREKHIALITGLKKNMHTNKPMLAQDALFLRKRSIVETIIDQLKNISQIEHSRHRSPQNFLVNLICGLIAYCHQPKKPALPIFPQVLQAA